MAELRHQMHQQPHPTPSTHETSTPRSHQVAKSVAAATAGGSLLLLSGLTLAGTVIALTIATPLLVIFSPVLVPAAITVAMLIGGFLSSGGFGVAAVSVLSWIYSYLTGKHPVWSDQIEQARVKLASKARDMKERAEHYSGAREGGVGVGAQAS